MFPSVLCGFPSPDMVKGNKILALMITSVSNGSLRRMPRIVRLNVLMKDSALLSVFGTLSLLYPYGSPIPVIASS